MAKIEVTKDENGTILTCFFDCPGCGLTHEVHIEPNHNDLGASWKFNGDFDRPTFSPSILARVMPRKGKPMVCHFFVDNGQLKFLGDCTHGLVEEAVEMVEVEA